MLRRASGSGYSQVGAAVRAQRNAYVTPIADPAEDAERPDLPGSERRMWRTPFADRSPVRRNQELIKYARDQFPGPPAFLTDNPPRRLPDDLSGICERRTEQAAAPPEAGMGGRGGAGRVRGADDGSVT
ncbi:hypothetical protein GCM10010353_54600 [Streptomyces chryseus]|nr:hypothetical protein GCM10010353_54600 [Streptomyces chryseus]